MNCGIPTNIPIVFHYISYTKCNLSATIIPQMQKKHHSWDYGACEIKVIHAHSALLAMPLPIFHGRFSSFVNGLHHLTVTIISVYIIQVNETPIKSTF